jgi:hypothetical protein
MFQSGKWNETITKEDDFDAEQWLDDLIHFRNLPSAKSMFVWFTTIVHYVFDFFVSLSLSLELSVND